MQAIQSSSVFGIWPTYSPNICNPIIPTHPNLSQLLCKPLLLWSPSPPRPQHVELPQSRTSNSPSWERPGGAWAVAEVALATTSPSPNWTSHSRHSRTSSMGWALQWIHLCLKAERQPSNTHDHHMAAKKNKRITTLLKDKLLSCILFALCDFRQPLPPSSGTASGSVGIS